MGVLWEVSVGYFLLMTVFVGGGAAYLSGRAIAMTWRPFWQAIAYVVLLALATRFLHFALFEGTLLSFHYLVIDFVVLAIASVLGFRLMRVGQMVTQYSWLYQRSGPFSWRERQS